MDNDPEKVNELIQQLMGQYPNFKPTSGFTVGLATMFMVYPEPVLREATNPVHGIAGHHKFFPSLAELKTFLDGIAERQHRARAGAAKGVARPEPKPTSEPLNRSTRPSRATDAAGLYIGPIDLVRPGDLLPYWRLEEYDLFMQSKGMHTVKHWGLNEDYHDSGARPFQFSANPERPAEPAQSPQAPSPEPERTAGSPQDHPRHTG